MVQGAAKEDALAQTARYEKDITALLGIEG